VVVEADVHSLRGDDPSLRVEWSDVDRLLRSGRLVADVLPLLDVGLHEPKWYLRSGSLRRGILPLPHGVANHDHRLVVVAAVAGEEGVARGNLHLQPNVRRGKLHLRPNELRKELQRQQMMVAQGVMMMSRHPLKNLGKLAKDG